MQHNIENFKKPLFPSYAPPEKWRDKRQSKGLRDVAWKALRQKILTRDNYTCAYCGFKSEKYQILDHIDGDPKNNEDENFQIVCQMCNLIKHSGQGCVINGIVDLYKESNYSQNEIIKLTRKMRDKGKTDREIINFLGLKQKVPFKQDWNYLKPLYGFITSRKPLDPNDMYAHWLEYHKKTNRQVQEIRVEKKITEWL